MVRDIISVGLIVLVYVCLFVVVFAPTIYATWFFIVGRRVKIKRKGLLRAALITLCINSVVAYFLIHLAFDYFLTAKIAEKDALAAQTLQNALVSQTKFFDVHGRYYSIGPVRGPYRDDRGLAVGKDVILLVEPRWDKSSGRERLEAYALHVWGKRLLTGTVDGKVKPVPDESEYFARLRRKMLNSVK
jgi:uncharacterized protein (DUF58 family)